ncbi:MAG: LacI family DNA-binding transcriptional regulator [Anaerolineales bacterium]
MRKKQEKPSPTIREVAKLAGVAPITVSRVINNGTYIRDDTKKRVKAAIRQLGYVPNTLARSLRSRRTCTLALVLTDITNPFWTTLARGAEDAAREAGFSMILGNTDESEAKQGEYLNVLLQKQVDGILFVPVGRSVAPVQLLHRQAVPVVVLDRRLDGARADVVRSDSEGGAYQLIKLLLSLGHRRIALLCGPHGVSTAEDRAAGYKRALSESNLACEPELIQYGEFTVESGYAMAHRTLSGSPRPTALFAGNNFIAIGALKALRDMNLRVPDDIAIVGFDDLPTAIMVDPILTVARQPAYEMGKRAAELLIARLAGEAEKGYQEIILPTEIIVRQSSGLKIAPAVGIPRAQSVI